MSSIILLAIWIGFVWICGIGLNNLIALTNMPYVIQASKSIINFLQTFLIIIGGLVELIYIYCKHLDRKLIGFLKSKKINSNCHIDEDCFKTL